MDTVSLSYGLSLIVGIMTLVGLANLVDLGVRTKAQARAKKAEDLRFQKWGLPAPYRPEPPRNDEHLWHFSDN